MSGPSGPAGTTGTTGPSGAAGADTPDLDSGAWRLDPQVALRPERFGALAYHYGTRRLTFLRSPLLARLVEALAEHPDVASALDEVVPASQRPTYRKALGSLAASGFLVPR
ncbi:MAG TPA: mycofactocin biosynthesis chaperone MftB [Acidimicrobiales bacterium]|nr:mycofactocin biosynthesis chaperone MftB [Acidimicrobiales bacterium]